MRQISIIALALFALGLNTLTLADTLQMPAHGEQRGMEMPVRGMNMDQVRAQFGPPREIRTAFGQPPITRWVYENYTVYFEYRHVIHSVANRP